MVDFRPVPGREREHWNLGENLTLLAVEYNGTSATDTNGAPFHYLDVQVAMFDGVNDQLRRQSNAHLKWDALSPGGDGNPLTGYSSDQMLEIISAAWQQDDLASVSTALSDVTEQNVTGRDGSVLGTVYVIQADVATAHGGRVPRIVPGSVRKADESLVPLEVMAEQRSACAKAWAAEAAERATEVAAVAGRPVDHAAAERSSSEIADGSTPQM